MSQQKFELSKVMINLLHMNIREEKHGEESVPAVDLTMSMRTGNDCLDALYGPGVRDSFYAPPDLDDADLADQGNADVPIRIRHPNIPKIRWEGEQMNTEVRFPYGLGLGNDIVLQDAKVNKFVLELLDGGTVVHTWRVQSVATPDQIGRLAERVNAKTVEVEITYNEPEEVQPALTNDETPNPVEAAAREQEDEAAPRRSRGRQAAVH